MSFNQGLSVLAGPILRKITPNQMTIWLATSKPVDIELSLFVSPEQTLHYDSANGDTCHTLTASPHCYFHLIHFQLEETLPFDSWVGYDLKFHHHDLPAIKLTELIDDICYPGKSTPGFVLRSKLEHILHGSCRKPHHKGNERQTDGLVVADEFLQTRIESPNTWPGALIMSGDQIYADDVATPMLVAIHRLLKELNWASEKFNGAQIDNSDELKTNASYYNHREQILPKDKVGGEVKKLLFSSVKKPIFTSDNAGNHLIALDEVLAMYLLAWSPEPWCFTDFSMPDEIAEEERETYYKQQQVLETFVKNLNQVRRVMAHLPCAMIFDDHDVTDDWNLTANWEKTAYQNDFSKRILGNALFAYFICQGWGNEPSNFSPALIEKVQQSLDQLGEQTHQDLIDDLLNFGHWHYHWQTTPKLLVLDSRTQRWQSLSKPDKPSGLMDWEALIELQQSLFEQESVVLVSPAPMFGVKLIEAIQQVFTWFGKPLMVDAENWMAHKGAAYTLLNLFRHPKTPQNFVILSGDVHYSFAFKVSLRGRKNSPNIWQITSSGLKNEFPPDLLNWLDRLNRWLYAPWSPLNWFTKRKNMKVKPIKPAQASHGERLLNQAGIGLVELDEKGAPRNIYQLIGNGEQIAFSDKD
ncbi:alkaline phosphatase D family protein [Catenovulum sp. 2E275]|uniref:alkaline phosphatase D family protein n=1 Tax=Catenovulum sp. 2E275 TaxID=2980497 RepID=UPI0021CFC39A|nr:alkaline phosphatase D family protein [Catenovulum sp. 2E275]MCU4674366.1 alkaline phosphatase D family protein [Catenovulum sp. 2E275]